MKEHSLFSVIGEKLDGHTVALIIAKTGPDAEYYARHKLGFVTVSKTGLISDCVYVGSADIKPKSLVTSKVGRRIRLKS
jgi:hypothetical protein